MKNPDVLGSGVQVAPVSASGTITSGGTAQAAIAANASRRGFSIQNRSAETLYINTEGTAVADGTSLAIAPGQLYECPPWAVPVTAVSIIGATTGSAFFAREWN